MKEDVFFESFGLGEIDQFLVHHDYQIDFSKVVRKLFEGDEYAFLDLFQQVGAFLSSHIVYEKNILIQLLVLAIASAFLTSLAGIFENRQIVDTSFFVAYILMSSILMSGFEVILAITVDFLETMLTFMQVLIPSYFLSIRISNGTMASVVFYELTLGVITLVDWLFLKIVIPMIRIYFVILLMNHISSEDLLSKMGELFEQGIGWCLKTFLGIVIGLHVMESLVAPGIDGVKRGTLERIIKFIPGIGDGAEAMSQVIVGSSMLIKNGIGVAALICIVIICAIPIMKVGLFSLGYQFAAAMVQPVVDHRITGSFSCMAKSCRMLLQVIVTVGLLFFFSIAIICGTTNHY